LRAAPANRSGRRGTEEGAPVLGRPREENGGVAVRHGLAVGGRRRREKEKGEKKRKEGKGKKGKRKREERNGKTEKVRKIGKEIRKRFRKLEKLLGK
jgi:hypothetical protein